MLPWQPVTSRPAPAEYADAWIKIVEPAVGVKDLDEPRRYPLDGSLVPASHAGDEVKRSYSILKILFAHADQDFAEVIGDEAYAGAEGGGRDLGDFPTGQVAVQSI